MWHTFQTKALGSGYQARRGLKRCDARCDDFMLVTLEGLNTTAPMKKAHKQLKKF